MIYYREVKWSDLPQICLRTGTTTAVIFLLIGTSQAMSWVLAYERIPQTLSESLLAVTDQRWGILLIINTILLLVGTFMDMTPAVLVFTPIFLPVTKALGMDPVHFGIIMIVNLCIGLCTPPVGTCLFVGCGVGKTSLADVTKPIIPFLIAMVITLFVITYVPALSLWLPIFDWAVSSMSRARRLPSVPWRRNWPVCLAVAAALASSSSVSSDSPPDYNRDIRPILSENCFHCHGPDDNARQAELRLDVEAGAHEYVIVAGDPESSELFQRVVADDSDYRMPPPDSGRELTQGEIQLLRDWIANGGEYAAHWSFVPPRKTVVPGNASAVDHFIDKTLASAGVRPAPTASAETLIRRITFTLTGLPPTLEEIDEFLADQTSTRYERLVGRLLARESFGERMAAEWLDVARYSDTYGYQVDRDRYVWPWRDWVIRAYNQNMPFDQFRHGATGGRSVAESLA